MQNQNSLRSWYVALMAAATMGSIGCDSSSSGSGGGNGADTAFSRVPKATQPVSLTVSSAIVKSKAAAA